MDMSNLIMHGMFVLILGMLLIFGIVEVSTRRLDKDLMAGMVPCFDHIPEVLEFGVGSIVRILSVKERDIYECDSGIKLDECYTVAFDFPKLKMLYINVHTPGGIIARPVEYNQVALVWKEVGLQLEQPLDV